VRLTGALAALLCLSGTAAIAAEAGQTCRTSHNLVGACFSVHGRLYNSPSGMRLSWDQTGRTLAVLDRQSGRGDETIPAEIRALFGPNSTGGIEGDYVVCPFDRTHLARIQAVCIEAALHAAGK